MTDRRVNRTERAIKKAFIQLLNEKDLAKITVSEIANQADIGRGTFYTHYQDIYDLHQSIIDEVATKLLTIFKKYYQPALVSHNFLPLFHALANYIASQQDLLSFLTNQKNSMITVSYLQDRFKRELINYHEQETTLDQLVESVYGISGIFGIFIDWLQGKIKASPTELGEAIGNFANQYWV